MEHQCVGGCNSSIGVAIGVVALVVLANTVVLCLAEQRGRGDCAGGSGRVGNEGKRYGQLLRKRAGGGSNDRHLCCLLLSMRLKLRRDGSGEDCCSRVGAG